MTSPAEIWEQAKEEPQGLVIDQHDDLRDLEEALLAYRKKLDDPELYGFQVTRTKSELIITRSTNIGQVRMDGDYRPMED